MYRFPYDATTFRLVPSARHAQSCSETFPSTICVARAQVGRAKPHICPPSHLLFLKEKSKVKMRLKHAEYQISPWSDSYLGSPGFGPRNTLKLLFSKSLRRVVWQILTCCLHLHDRRRHVGCPASTRLWYSSVPQPLPCQSFPIHDSQIVRWYADSLKRTISPQVSKVLFVQRWPPPLLLRTTTGDLPI
jgi:hypothetical protein